MTRKARKHKYCWHPDEAMAILEHCRTKPDLQWLHPIALTLLTTGMLPTELVRLRWPDIDFERLAINITDETDDGPRPLKFGQCRGIPMPAELLVVLRSIPRSGPRVFHGPRGERLRLAMLRRAFTHAVIEPLSRRYPSPPGQEDFKDSDLHTFRHFYFATHCQQQSD